MKIRGSGSDAYDIMKRIGRKYQIDTTDTIKFRGIGEEPFKWKESIDYARPRIWNICNTRLSRYRYTP